MDIDIGKVVFSYRKNILIPLLLLASAMTSPVPAQTASMRVYKEFKGHLTTNIKGTSTSIPPHVKVIRSKEGMTKFIDKFREIRNYPVHLKVNQLESNLKRVNFDQYMLVAVMTEPIDNYSISVSKVLEKDGALQVYVNYSHTNRNDDIPGKKSVYYNILMLKKSDMPVMLKLNNLSGKKKADASVNLTGRLLYWKYSDLQLVPHKGRGKKSVIYYIKGSQAKKFEKYVGRVVTVRAIISRDQDSPYEKDIVVEKITRVYENP